MHPRVDQHVGQQFPGQAGGQTAGQRRGVACRQRAQVLHQQADAGGGFLLNNELTDFSFRTHRNGVPIANRVEPGKRPRSSMSPTIVLKNGAPSLVVGSPGGSRIIGYVAQTIIAHLDWGMDVQQAVTMPHLVNRFGTFDVEAGTTAEGLTTELEGLGYKVNARALTSGLHAISVGDGLQGGAYPRREGIAIGE